MRRSLRLSERWFHRGLWIVAVVFAFCLIGLGSIVVDDLPHVEHQAQRDENMTPESSGLLRLPAVPHGSASSFKANTTHQQFGTNGRRYCETAGGTTNTG